MLLFLQIRKDQPKAFAGIKDLTHQSLKQAKKIGTTLNDHRITSYAHGYAGQLYESERRYEEAVQETRQAIFFAQLGRLPEILYLWQWQLGRLFKAMDKADMAVTAYQQAIKTLNPIRHDFFKGYRDRKDTFNEKVKPVYLGLAELYIEQNELYQARDTMESIKKAELQEFFQDECATAAIVENIDVDRTAKHTALIYPIVLPRNLILLLTLPDGIKLFKVPVDSDTVVETVVRFRRRLQTRPNNRFLYDAWQLYDWIIRPLEADLKAHDINTLVFAPDGILRLIPFSTFHDRSRFLVEKYAIGTVPAITLTDPKSLLPENMDILINGLSEARHGFSPLPGVIPEVNDIKTIMNAKTSMLNQTYTIENLTRALEKHPYTIIHIATHGIFGESPEDTFLLTYESKLTMDGLEKLIGLTRFRKTPVELLTLSACQTGVGDEWAALGLAGIAVKAGVRSALATLWFVDDESTALAVREFYRQLKKPDTTKARALQNAQKKLIAQPRYWHPLYWAQFLLIGNWL